MEHVVAVDIGGTKMEAGIVTADGRLVERARVATDPTADADGLWAPLAEIVGGLTGRTDALAVGVGSGGPMAPGGETVSPLNIPGWREFPLRARLAELTGLATYVDNDAKALALAEGWIGAARGEANFIAMVVSTGVGGGIVLDGRLLDGARGNAGHIGHVVVEPDGFTLPDHAQGVLEGEASGTAIRAKTGRPAAEADAATIEATGTLVGRGVASVCNLLDLRLAVVAGSVALGFGAPFFAAAQAEIDRRCLLDFSRGARIIPAGLGDEGPLVGAAAVAWRALGRDIGIT
ncbi:MAG TPA: ROK family protein [Acidimicrobiales bacterium]|nr:ROK family protein [Acidimicrobiales bacterium]